MTHILIPIKDVEEWKNESQNDEADSMYINIGHQVEIPIFDKLLAYKQISLDENDMKPSIHTLNAFLNEIPEETDNPATDYKAGYKQAIMDLLK